MTIRDSSVAVPGTLGIGDRLRNAREAKRITFDAAAQQTRIRVTYLQALEDEEFGKLPGPIYAKGFLRAYAAALGLDADELVAVYPEAFAVPHASLAGRPAEIPIRPVAPPSRLRRVMIYGLVITFLVAVMLGYIGYQGWRAFNAPPVVPSPNPSTASSPFEDAPMAAVPRPAPVAPQPLPPPPVAPAPASGTLAVTVRASGTTWLRVVIGGRRAFEGMLHAGDARTWSAPAVTVRLGNAPVAAVDVNGRRIAIPSGQRVWEQTFTAGRQ
ncbi:MAG: helix-turn-helix domain-containing protein [bacterium]